MLKLSELRGQHIAIRQLGNALKSGKPSHAYLFSGPDGVGKRTAALSFAAALNCSGEAGDLCGACPSCRKIVSATHSDVQVVGPSGSSLKIEQVRLLQKSINLSPMEGRYKVAIVNDADRLTTAAANSLLKVLEEPPGLTVFILITANEAALPPTVISRCQRIAFRPLSSEVLAELLSDCLSVDKVEMAVSLAGGSLSQARYLMEMGPSAGGEKAERIIRGVLEKDRSTVRHLLSDGDFHQENGIEMLQHMLNYWRHRLLRAVSSDASGCGSGVALDMHGLSPLQMSGIIEQTLATQKLIRQNVSVPLALEVLTINMWDIIHGGIA